MSHPWIADRKRVCMNKHLQATIENLAKFNARRRLKGAVVDAFANKLSYYHAQPGNGQSPGLFAANESDMASSYGAIGQVLDSLDEIDALRQDEANELAQVLDDSALHKWLDIYDGISSLDLSQKRIPPAHGEVRFAEVLQFLQFMPPGDGPGPELTNILLNPHFSKLMICHDLIAAQIYQQPNLRLYPPGSSGSVGQFSKSSSGGTTCSASSNEVAQINQSAVAGPPSTYPDPQIDTSNLRKVRFEKRVEEPLGITLRMENGRCLVARVIIGGMIHRQQLLNVGDEIFEINGISVRYKDIAELQMMLRSLRGTITFTLSPSNTPASPTCEIYVRALFDFDPMMSSDIPCKEAGLKFQVGEVLMISSKDDDFWWQAKNMDTEASGLIPRYSPKKPKILVSL